MVRQCVCPCRFDVAPDERKYPQEDFASIAGLTKANGGNDYKYSNLRGGHVLFRYPFNQQERFHGIRP